MDNQRNPLLTWAYYCQGKSVEELRQSLLFTTLELETTRLKAEEELKIRDAQFSQLKNLLSEAIRERDEAQDKCHTLLFQKLFLQQQQQQQQQQQPPAPLSGISSVEEIDEPRRGLDGFSSSDCDESIVSSPPQLPPPPSLEEPILPLVSDKPLPEKGKLLQAVMKAGPLLQSLLLAGPLPQWRHPPPPIDSYQIPPPPVAIPPPPPQLVHQDSLLSVSTCNNVDNNCVGIDNGNRKRCFSEGSDSPTEAKYQRLVLQ